MKSHSSALQASCLRSPRSPHQRRTLMSAKSIAASIIVCLAVLCLHLSLPITACAQAWLPREGDGRVTLTYQNLHVRYHRNYLGQKTDQGPIRTHTALMSFEYGLTNNLAIDAEVAHVSSKFEGFITNPPHGPADTGAYHPTFQDARITVRYNTLNTPFVVTPYITVAF